VTKSEIFKNLYTNLHRRYEFVDSLPDVFGQALVENDMTEAYDADVSMLMEAVFGEHMESIYWFLYEWKPGFEVGFAGKELTKIHSIDQYIEYMKANEGFND
jgi:hypothetical protein